MTGGIPRSYDRNVHHIKQLLINLVLCFSLLLSINCAAAPVKTDIIPAASQPIQSPHVRKLTTPPYAGGGGVIFVLDQISDSIPRDALGSVIRLFAENNAPLTVAVKPTNLENTLDVTIKDLSYFADAGIVDISIDGYSLDWLRFQTTSTSQEYSRMVASLVKARGQVKYAIGSPPFACILPAGAVNEANYLALQESGFKILCSPDADTLPPSVKPVSWPGEIAAGGLYRLPIAGTFAFSPVPEPFTALMADVKKSINGLGVAVIEIQLPSILDSNNKIDSAKLAQLKELIKSCGTLGAVTTLENWYYYITGCPPDAAGVKRPLPPYDGGPVIIFRLDDVSRGNREEAVQEIIKLFQRNGVPLDCGVVSNAGGTDSYEIPWLKKYVDENAVGISVHGYDWTFYQLDITKKYLAHIEDNPCINVNAAKAEAEKAKISYEDLKFKLLQARCKFLKYFGVMPVSFTVPTDFYDELGYKAIQAAGYKVFSVHRLEELCPSTGQPCDYNCHTNLTEGMYRIPTATDLCNWDYCKWGDVINLDKPMAQKDYCTHIDAWGESIEYNDYGITICSTMNALGVAAIGLHPDGFIDKDGKPDMAKLEKVDAIIKWFKSFATIMTFEQWYRFRTGEK